MNGEPWARSGDTESPDGKRGVGPMLEYIPEIESLTSEELLSIVLAIVAPVESDPCHEYGLRFEAQRAATELYCRAASAQRAKGVRSAPPLRGLP
jgi:hypothetical protein